MAGKFVLKKTAKGEFVFNLKAANGLIILTSPIYTDKDSALNGIKSARKNAARKENYEHRMGTNGEPYFVLKAANKQIIGHSEMYSSSTNMEKGIASVRRNAPLARFEDIAH
jgi:uncharacterized protein YegP (UPF0339 family)